MKDVVFNVVVAGALAYLLLGGGDGPPAVRDVAERTAAGAGEEAVAGAEPSLLDFIREYDWIVILAAIAGHRAQHVVPEVADHLLALRRHRLARPRPADRPGDGAGRGRGGRGQAQTPTEAPGIRVVGPPGGGAQIPPGVADRRGLRRRRVAAEWSRPAADAVAEPHQGRQVHLGGHGAAVTDHRGRTRPRESRAGPLGGLGADRARVGVGHRGLPALPAARLAAPARPAHHLRPRRQRPRRHDRCTQRRVERGTVRLRGAPVPRDRVHAASRGAGPGACLDVGRGR